MSKARETFDHADYEHAIACANAIFALDANSLDALLLRGHVDQNLHRFYEAEAAARRLVAERGNPFDYALLGDALLEQGKLEDALPAYQNSLDLRPDLHSYARAGYARWLIGDVDGAIKSMECALGASSPADPESLAWTATRLATFQYQAGNRDVAGQLLDRALAAKPENAHALLLRGRILMTEGDAPEAVTALRTSAEVNPIAEPQWTLAEALREAGQTDEAAEIEQTLLESGEQTDPRTLALFLATRNEKPDLAVRLAGNELRERQDIFSHDAFAWALSAAGRSDEAIHHLDRALAEGTEDGRLFFHAAVINQRTGHLTEAREWADEAAKLSHTLLPSERQQLFDLEQKLTATLPTDANAEAGETRTKKTSHENPYTPRCHIAGSHHPDGRSASLQSHGCSAHHARSGRKYDGRLRVRR